MKKPSKIKSMYIRSYKDMQSWAGRQVRAEIKKGTILRKPCERCGAEKTQGHHEDYSKPLDVIWLCQKHHNIRHKELRAMKKYTYWTIEYYKLYEYLRV